MKAEKKCCLCDRVKAAAHFHSYAYTMNNGTRGRRLESRCKACRRERRATQSKAENARQRARWKARSESKKKEHNDYRRGNPVILVSRLASEHKRRARGWRNDVGPGRAAVAEALELARIGDKYLDAYSGELIDDPTIDHIKPLSEGGTNDLENLCVTSRWNNTSKHNKPLIVWLAERARLVS